MGRRRSRLSDDDRDLWTRLTASETPSHQRDPPPPPPAPAPSDPVRSEAPRPALPTFRIGARADTATPGHVLTPPISKQLAEACVRMDRKAYGRMRKGKLTPEARLDLHGMSQAQAHPALTRFIHASHSRGLRLVLVITGKGKDRDAPGPMPVPRGVLKHQVPHWLSAPGLRGLVLQVTEAHIRHGGTGAYYVYLRRPR